MFCFCKGPNRGGVKAVNPFTRHQGLKQGCTYQRGCYRAGIRHGGVALGAYYRAWVEHSRLKCMVVCTLQGLNTVTGSLAIRLSLIISETGSTGEEGMYQVKVTPMYTRVIHGAEHARGRRRQRPNI